MSEELFHSSQLKVERFVMGNGEGLAWQRCPVADRVLVVQEGRGFFYLTRGRDEHRDEVGPGDTRLAPRMAWHRLVAAPDQGLTATLVTHVPANVELRR